MKALQAVIFDLGGTLVEWPDEDPAPRWGRAYDFLGQSRSQHDWPDRSAFVQAMVAAELAHWARVVDEQWSGPPSGLVHDGLSRLQREANEASILSVLDAYARAIEGFSVLCPGAVETLMDLREQGYPCCLLSNTWWAAEWHNAELAAHGLAPFFDEVVYTSDLPHSKPHPMVFREAASRLGVEPATCVMVGDRPIDDIAGANDAGMWAIWKRTEKPRPTRDGIVPAATITRLAELPPLLRRWREGDGARN